MKDDDLLYKKIIDKNSEYLYLKKEKEFNINKKIDIIKNYNKIVFDNYKKVDNFNNLFAKDIKPNRDIQGKSYNTSTMWSPTSTAGVVYQWNRGVIAIGAGGEMETEVLDGTTNHHADATVRLSSLLGVNIPNTTAPFEAAINSSNEGLIIFQAEGDNSFVYLPKSITAEQLESLKEIITPRANFNISFTHDELIFENVSVQELLKYVSDLVDVPKMAM